MSRAVLEFLQDDISAQLCFWVSNNASFLAITFYAGDGLTCGELG
jgi:hypothetical protein